MAKSPFQEFSDIMNKNVDPIMKAVIRQEFQKFTGDIYYLYKSRIGYIDIVQTQEHISRISFCDDKAFFEPPLKPETDLLKQVQNIFDLYFAGESVDFKEIPISIEVGTEFQKSVWNEISQIPYGEVRSYKWIAEHIERPKAVRAVGNATGRNPISIINPCHRVIGSKGKFGGYGGGLKRKRQLLKLEGYPVEGLSEK